MAEKTGPARHRVQLDYFKKRNFLRRQTVRLSVAGMGIAGIWLIVGAVWGHMNLYSPGAVSAPHAFVGTNCVACHSGPQKAVFSRTVTDHACESCHAGPVHHSNQIFAGRVGAQPSCASCHQEHRGRNFRPAIVSDRTCTQCHEALPQATAALPADPKGPAAGFAASVTSFSGDHPEFRIIAEHRKDETPIKLNHQKHLRPDLPGSDGKKVQMLCGDCHHMKSDGTVAPVDFERDCRSCHPLAFDERIREQAPHEDPVIVEAFIRTAFSKYTGNDPNQWKADVDWHPARKLAELNLLVDQAPRNLPALLEQRIKASTRFLFEKKCQECHLVKNLADPIPVVVKPEIPRLWLTHARFSHTPHLSLQCQSCHKGVAESSLTSDVLLPSRSDCLQCHNPPGAPSACATCHTYHDKTISNVRRY